MDVYTTFTDGIVDEILCGNLSDKDKKSLIKARYRDKGFTLIGAKKEIRIVTEKIQANRVNRFDDIIAATLTIISGFISFFFINSIFDGGIIFKILIPMITVLILFYLFATTLNDMRDRCDTYKLCVDRLAEILEGIQEEYNRAEMKKIIESNLEKGTIFDIDKTSEESENLNEEDDENEDEEVVVEDGVDSVEIDSFEFDLDDLNDDAVVEFA